MQMNKAVKMVIKPDMAEKMLAKSRLNRAIRSRLLSRLINDIKSGNWRVTGETIIFDDEGYLTDGQHRLMACVETGIAITSYVVLGGIDPDAMFYTDLGVARTPGDALHMLGRSDSNLLASTCRWVYRYETGSMGHRASIMPRDMLMEKIEKYVTLPDSLTYGRRVVKFMTVSLGGALHYLMAQKDRELANMFFNEIGFGSDDRISPTFVLREKLTTSSRRAAKHPEHYIAAWTIKAWNLIRVGRTAKVINWYPDSPTKPEPFPVIR